MKTFIAVVLLIFSSSLGAQGFTIEGFMQHTTLEGGCWYLQSNEGKNYELVGDQDKLSQFRNVGPVVKLTVEPVKNGASVCMIGQIVRVLEIQDLHRPIIDLPTTRMKLSGTVQRT